MKKKTFIKNFTKVVYGFASVEANSKREAEDKFSCGDFDEFDNKSDYEWTGEAVEEE